MFRIATAAYSCCPLCLDSSRSCASCSLTAPMQAPSSTTVPPQRCAVWWSRLSNALMAPRALSSNPSVGSLSAPLPGSIAAGGSPRTGKTATTMHSPSSASPPSASCSDGSVILHEVFGRTLRASSDEQYQFGQEVWEAYLLDCDNDIIYDQTNTFGTLIIRERGYVRHNRHTNLSGTDLKGARRLY